MSTTRLHAARQFWVVVHRWAGLTTALFLAVAGLTGCALAWEDDLEALTAPQLLLAAPNGHAMRDVVGLRDAALARHPGMAVDFMPLTVAPGHALRLRTSWADAKAAPDWDELFIDPYTGAELGHRRWGDITQGTVNLLPMLYRLHYTLLAGSYGEWVMGVVALVWTLDCFVGFYLTLPPRKAPTAPRGPGWRARWMPAWKVRWGTNAHKVSFDLHRAGGLWVWPVLLVFALSSVSLALPQVYGPLARAAGGTDERAMLAKARAPAPDAPPAMNASAARDRGQALAGAQRVNQGTAWLWHIPSAGLYVYGFSTSHDVGDDVAGARVAFDDRSGALRYASLPQTAPAADRFTNWIVALHMANVFGWPWRVFETVIGVAVTALSITGVLIWMKKRTARLFRLRREARQLPV